MSFREPLTPEARFPRRLLFSAIQCRGYTDALPDRGNPEKGTSSTSTPGRPPLHPPLSSRRFCLEGVYLSANALTKLNKHTSKVRVCSKAHGLEV